MIYMSKEHLSIKINWPSIFNSWISHSAFIKQITFHDLKNKTLWFRQNLNNVA